MFKTYGGFTTHHFVQPLLVALELLFTRFFRISTLPLFQYPVPPSFDLKMHLFIGSMNFTHAPGLAAAVNEFVADRSLVWNWITTYWADFVSWLEQPSRSSIMNISTRTD